MNVEKTIEKLNVRINELETQVRTLKDIEEIKKLQRAYGYYVEQWNSKEIFKLFSKNPEVSVKANAGEFRGP
jgi:Fic family protein